MERLALPLRVLFSAPRPASLDYAPSRAKTEAIFAALEAQGDQAVAEWLWPVTEEALKTRLGADERPGVLVLDVATSEGGQGFSPWFEDAGSQGRSVDPARLGADLRDSGLRALIVVGNPGQGTASAEALGAVLANAANLPVLWLSEQLPTQRVEKAMSAFFAALLGGQPLSLCLTEARKGLGKREIPTAAEAEAILLFAYGEDSPLVQVATESGRGVGKVVRFPSADLSPAWTRLAGEPHPGGLPPEPAHGFVGRARELAALEGALRGSHGNGLVVVSGYEGIGKTTLAAHAARWLVRVGRFKQAVYTSFAGGGYIESALYDLGMRLCGDDFTLGEDASARVEAAAAETPTLIIWDGFEALLAGGESALQPEALSRLLQLGARLATAGTTRLCILSENVDIPDSAYSGGATSLTLALSGLATKDALDLVIMLSAGTDTRWPASEETAALVDALDGHPLALCIAPRLFLGETPTQVIDTLEGILPGVRAGEARHRNQALDVVMEALLRKLDADFSSGLEPLSLLVGGALEPLVATLTGLEERTWSRAKKRLGEMRLAYEIPLPALTVPWIRISSALLQRLGRRMNAERRAAVQRTYCVGYMGLMRSVIQNAERAPAMLKYLVRWELANTRRAFRLLLSTSELDIAGESAQLLTYVLNELGFRSERDAVLKTLEEAVAAAAPAEGPLTRPGVTYLISNADKLLAAGRVPEAGNLLQGLAQRMQAEGGMGYSGDDAALDLGMVLHRLGRCLQVMGNAEEAVNHYARALNTLGAIQAEVIARRELLSLYEDLGAMFMLSGGVEQAGHAYRAGLEIAEKLADEHAVGSINARLGNVAMAGNDVEQARLHYQAAIDHLSASGDIAGEGEAWSQLGAAQLRSGNIEEAERCYNEALNRARQAEHVTLQAQTLMLLAAVAEQANRVDDAQSRYAEAMELCKQHDLRAGVVSAEVALARSLLRQLNVEKAKELAEDARAIVEEVGSEAHPWEVHSLLELIATVEGDVKTQQQWRTRAQESFAASPEAEQALLPWQPIIRGVARACRGESLDAETVELLEKLESTPAWKNLATAMWRILDGERDPDFATPLDYVDALVVRRILETIENPPPEQSPEGNNAAEEGDDGALGQN